MMQNRGVTWKPFHGASTLEGQRVKAILNIKQKPWYPVGFGPVISSEVGDFMEVLEYFPENASRVKVRNLRTEGVGMISWYAFKRVGPRAMCVCDGERCYCVYKDFEASCAYYEKKNRKEKKG